MKFGLNDEQNALAQSAKRFLQEHAGCEIALELMAQGPGFDPATWSLISGELGWTALTIPEAYGGYGLGYTDLIPLLEAMGHHMLCAPFFSSICLGAAAILEAATPAQKSDLLPRLASGERRTTLALGELAESGVHAGFCTTYEKFADGFILTGHEPHVLDAHTAHSWIVAAREKGSEGESGLALFVVEADSANATCTPLATLDETRKAGSIQFTGTQVSHCAKLGENNLPWTTFQKILDLGSIALALEQVGGAERCLETAVSYATMREQFGRPIGSFQAIKHKCADMLVLVESARSAAWYAAWAATENNNLSFAASQAKSYCSDAFYTCAAESIQIHGGIGFTWEHEAHLFFKRAQSSKMALGSPRVHRERIATLLEL